MGKRLNRWENELIKGANKPKYELTYPRMNEYMDERKNYWISDSAS